MNNIDYSALKEITVKSQEELDAIPDDFAERIYIEFGTFGHNAVVRKKYRKCVVARGNSSVVARGNSSVEARDNSSVEAWDNSSVEARGNSSVVARDNSKIKACANAQIVDKLLCGGIKIASNARIVYMPKTIEEYCDFYGIEHTQKTGKFYKCVHKRDDDYLSDYDPKFAYEIGKKAVTDCLDRDPTDYCGHGIHIAHLDWVLDFGDDWDDLAVLEVEADLDSIILPDDNNGKLRCKEVTVLREVPLEECGVYGKILAKRRGKV